MHYSQKPRPMFVHNANLRLGLCVIEYSCKGDYPLQQVNKFQLNNTTKSREPQHVKREKGGFYDKEGNDFNDR